MRIANNYLIIILPSSYFLSSRKFDFDQSFQLSNVYKEREDHKPYQPLSQNKYRNMYSFLVLFAFSWELSLDIE